MIFDVPAVIPPSRSISQAVIIITLSLLVTTLPVTTDSVPLPSLSKSALITRALFVATPDMSSRSTTPAPAFRVIFPAGSIPLMLASRVSTVSADKTTSSVTPTVFVPSSVLLFSRSPSRYILTVSVAMSCSTTTPLSACAARP